MGRVNWMIHCFDTLPSTGLLMNRRSSPGWSRCTRKCSRSLRSTGLIFASRLEKNQSAVLVDHCQLREEIAIDSQLLVHITGEVGVLQHRSAERRVGIECACPGRSRWTPANTNKNNKTKDITQT